MLYSVLIQRQRLSVTTIIIAVQQILCLTPVQQVCQVYSMNLIKHGPVEHVLIAFTHHATTDVTCNMLWWHGERQQ